MSTWEKKAWAKLGARNGMLINPYHEVHLVVGSLMKPIQITFVKVFFTWLSSERRASLLLVLAPVCVHEDFAERRHARCASLVLGVLVSPRGCDATRRAARCAP